MEYLFAQTRCGESKHAEMAEAVREYVNQCGWAVHFQHDVSNDGRFGGPLCIQPTHRWRVRDYRKLSRDSRRVFWRMLCLSRWRLYPGDLFRGSHAHGGEAPFELSRSGLLASLKCSPAYSNSNSGLQKIWERNQTELSVFPYLARLRAC